MVKKNKQVVSTFFGSKNEKANLDLIQNLFTQHYQIIDLAQLDVDKAAAVNIKKESITLDKSFRVLR